MRVPQVRDWWLVLVAVILLLIVTIAGAAQKEPSDVIKEFHAMINRCSGDATYPATRVGPHSNMEFELLGEPSMAILISRMTTCMYTYQREAWSKKEVESEDLKKTNP
jgi:hypothetical protein